MSFYKILLVELVDYIIVGHEPSKHHECAYENYKVNAGQDNSFGIFFQIWLKISIVHGVDVSHVKNQRYDPTGPLRDLKSSIGGKIRKEAIFCNKSLIAF